jgi:hypothetical protein
LKATRLKLSLDSAELRRDSGDAQQRGLAR